MMKIHQTLFTVLPFYFLYPLFPLLSWSQSAVPLPEGVEAVWDMNKAYRETMPTQERICVNGLWQWQPAAGSGDSIPTDGWGYIKVPAPWPGTSGEYMWRETQTVYFHPDWAKQDFGAMERAWYQRKISIPDKWNGRRIALSIEYLNSYADVYMDGIKVGEIRFPGGEVDITSACRPGAEHLLSLFTVAMPLKSLMESYSDTNSAKQIEGQVKRRGLCGDVFVVSAPAEAHVADVKIDTSVRNGEIALDVQVDGIRNGEEYILRSQIVDNNNIVQEFESQFTATDLHNGRIGFTYPWKPEKLWDTHTPQNKYKAQMSLHDSQGKVIDTFLPASFGFREFWIEGRDFWLNGSRIFCFAVPLDNAQISAEAASYSGARETLRRLKTFGVNAVYTHNYGCEPGTHLGFQEILKAADDEGMLFFFSQPHFAHYDWKSPDADKTNGYARHAEFFVRQAQNHPSVVMYPMSHNATGYSEDMNPDLMGESEVERDTWAMNNLKLALRAEEIVKRLDPSRIVYHHAGGNLGPMHTSNFYLNFTPIQERSDWFEHWSTQGIKPLFLCEYGEPWGINWTLYRGWYNGKRDFGSAAVPWQVCVAEWNAQFLGDRSFQLNEMDKANLRFEAAQARAGKLWHRWDYPYPVVTSSSLGSDNQEEVWSMYIKDNWRAFRTWELSGFNAWSYGSFWKLRDGADKSRKNFNVDWNRLQTPGFSPDYVDSRYERMDTAYESSDWIPTTAAKELIRNNQPLLAYIAGKPEHFTSKEHNFLPGQTVEKRIVVINNSRETVVGKCQWSIDFSQPISGSQKIQLETGGQVRIPLKITLPDSLAPGEYPLRMTVNFDSGKTQQDTFLVHVLPQMSMPSVVSKIALFDPYGETANLLRAMNITADSIKADNDLSAFDVLIVGKKALTLDSAAPNLERVRDGLKVIVFEQTPEVLEKRLGIRIQEYGLRRVFARIPNHPILDGLQNENLHDWAGESTIVPPRLDYEMRPMHGPTVRWCGIEVTRPWRCGCWGNVASVLIEKPAVGDFLPIVDGGFNLQYSPLVEYREGNGIILFCQVDVTGRTTEEPAAQRLINNLLSYISKYNPPPRRKALYAGEPVGRAHFEQAGYSIADYNGEALTSEQVLVVGAGGGEKLASHKESLAKWIENGGQVLAIGLDEREANLFLPYGVSMKKAEYIDTLFEPTDLDSPLAGVGPADVMIRDPQPIPLLTGGVTVVGNGILAYTEDRRTVFSQLAPWQFDYQKIFHQKMTFRRTGFLVSRLLANMNVSATTPLISRFSIPPDEDRWLSGLYLDKPEEMDDSYRFFRW